MSTNSKNLLRWQGGQLILPLPKPIGSEGVEAKKRAVQQLGRVKFMANSNTHFVVGNANG